MRTERTARGRPGRNVGAGPATALLVLLLAGCATTVPGTPWPAGAGPAPPAVTAVPERPDTGPSSFTEPGPSTEPRSAGAAPGPADSAATGPAGPVATGPPGPATTVAPVPVPPGPSPGGSPPGDRPRPPLAAATPPHTPPPHTVAPPTVAPLTRPGPRGTRPPAPRPGAAPAPVPPLTSDVVADECLLDRPALTGLLGAAPAVPAANADTRRPDGSRNRSCFAVGGSATVSVNVYTTNRDTPARYVRDAAGARTVAGTGAGTTAAVLDTVAGPALQLGTARHLVTISVAGRSPSDEQWRAAARAATGALARR